MILTKRLAIYCFFVGQITQGAEISLNACFLAAVAKTEPVQTARSVYAQSEAQLDSARGRFLPSISLNSTYQKQERTGSSSNGTFTQPDQWNARFALTQPILRGFGEYSEYRAAQKNRELQRIRVDGARTTLFRDVAKAYYDVLSSDSELSNLKAQHQTTNKRIEELKDRVRIGRSRQGELLAVRAQAAALNAQIASAQTQLEQQRYAFAATTGLDPNVTLALDVPSLSLQAIEYYEARASKRADLRAAEQRVAVAQERVSSARAGYFPTVDLTANYWLHRAGVAANVTWDVGVVLSLPLFQGGTVIAAVSQAQESAKQVRLEQLQLKRNALKEIRALYSAVSKSALQISAYTQAVELAELNFKAQSEDYKMGLVTNLEVLQALSSLYENKRLYDRTRFIAAAAFYSLQSSIGQIPQAPET